MKLKKTALALSVLVAAGSAAAEFSANIGATSNYVWRGVTQTGEDAAISGGLDYAHDSGFYAGTWASNVAGGEEVDLYAGFSGEASSLGYDVGVIYYAYPSFNDADFTEIYGSLTFGPVTGGINYTVDGQAESAGQDQFIGGDIYYYLSGSFEVMPTWSIGGTVGYYDFDEDGMGGNDISYAHIQGDITKSAGDFGDFTFSLSKADKESGDDDLKVFVSWAKTFE
ncbi:MAG TPA: TorF family putative porin [Gammaproteobacteria bacterium]|nr:TorF family putative porin [Gammaproteobacteria bacterium]